VFDDQVDVNKNGRTYLDLRTMITAPSSSRETRLSRPLHAILSEEPGITREDEIFAVAG
jgi:hypothetical protein